MHLSSEQCNEYVFIHENPCVLCFFPKKSVKHFADMMLYLPAESLLGHLSIPACVKRQLPHRRMRLNVEVGLVETG